MATARFTLGTVLSSVATTAETLTSTLNAVNKSVEMANAFVDQAALEQKLRYKMEAVGTKQRIRAEVAMEIALQQEQIQQWVGEDQARAKSFENILAQIDAALES